MELTKDIVALGNESTSIAKKRSAQAVMDKIIAVKQKGNGDEIISNFNMLQILGFNFKKAVGEPLTELVASLIRSNINTNDRNMELQILSQQRELEYFKICQDEEAYKRLMNGVNNK